MFVPHSNQPVTGKALDTSKPFSCTLVLLIVFAMRVKDEFLASMSHELRTPLTGVLGLSEALQMEVYGGLNDKQKNAIANIESSGRHLLELINDILDISKIEAGKLELLMEPCSLKDICQGSMYLTKGMAGKKQQGIRFTVLQEALALTGRLPR